MNDSDFRNNDFNAFWEKIKENDKRSWNRLNFSLQQSLRLFLKKKGIPENDIDEISQEVISLFYEKIINHAQKEQH